MVKNILLTITLLTFAVFTNSCFLIYEAFVYDSDIDERRLEMNNKILVDTLPPLDTGNGEYSFLVISDTHIEGGKVDGLDRLPQIIEEHGNIKFAIVLGDITEGEKDDFNVYLELVEELKNMTLPIPFYPVIGNHDLIGNGWKHWKSNIGSTNYKIEDDAGNASLLILDSAQIFYGNDQLNWLERELKTVSTRDVFVFSHVTPFSQGFYLQIKERERASIASILRNKVDAMFGGHNHVTYTHRTGNVDYVTVKSYRDDRAYCIVTVSDTGEISYDFKTF